MSKKGIFITIKILFIILIVILAAFVLFSVIKSRTQTLSQKEHFSYYPKVESFLEALITSPCLVSDYVKDMNYQVEQKGILSATKLNFLHNQNSDIHCIDNYHFLYTLEIEDILTKRQWVLGMREEPDVERIIQISLPVAVNYNYTTVHPGKATLVAYIGQVPKLCGQIRYSCATGTDSSAVLDTNNRIVYNSSTNKFCIESICHHPRFPCSVRSFSIKGKKMAYMHFEDGEVSVE